MVNEAINAKLPDEDDDDIECLDEVFLIFLKKRGEVEFLIPL